MKKIIIILIAVISITLVLFLGWYFLLSNQEAPFGEVIKNSLPFGSGGDTNLPALQNGTGGDGQLGEQLTPDEFGSSTNNLFRISDTPVAGFVTFVKSNQTTVRYVDRATGHIYDADLTTLTKTKVTNQTLPKVYEAYFRPDGNAVLLRLLKNDYDVVENLSLTLTPPKSTSTDALYSILSTPLRGDISAIAVAGSGNTLFYALRDTSSVVSSTFNGTSTKILLTSPFNNWRLTMTGESLVLYTKASSNVAGYAYTLNTSSGVLAKILGPLNGLTAVINTPGNKVLYSYVESNRTKLFTKNLTTKALSEISLATLAEKCVWSVKNTSVFFCGAPIDNPVAGEPDNWYRGLTHFSDQIWSFDTNNDTAQVLAEPKQTPGVDIDVVEPKLSPNEDYLIFINKLDLSLWALRLE